MYVIHFLSSVNRRSSSDPQAMLKHRLLVYIKRIKTQHQSLTTKTKTRSRMSRRKKKKRKRVGSLSLLAASKPHQLNSRRPKEVKPLQEKLLRFHQLRPDLSNNLPR